MKKTFALRIDIESDKGIKKGIPKILDLLKKYNVKASFYLVMGGESNLLDILKYRNKVLKERKIKVFSKLEMVRMVLFPRDFVRKNIQILRRILQEGHELGIHGWKHRAWTRGIGKIDIESHLRLAKERYIRAFKKQPISFAAPGFITNDKIISILDKEGFRVISDLPGKKPFKIKNTRITNVPVTITGPENTPIIENLASHGLNDSEILSIITKKIGNNRLSVMYIHDLYECIQKIGLIEKIIQYVKSKDINIKTIQEIKT